MVEFLFVNKCDDVLRFDQKVKILMSNYFFCSNDQNLKMFTIVPHLMD
jgi:hypothetical protein